MFWNDEEIDYYYKQLPQRLQKCVDIASKYCVSIRLTTNPSGYWRIQGYDKQDCNDIEVFVVTSYMMKKTICQYQYGILKVVGIGEITHLKDLINLCDKI